MVQDFESVVEFFPRHDQRGSDHEVRDPGDAVDSLLHHRRGHLLGDERPARELVVVGVERCLRPPVLDELHRGEEAEPADLPDGPIALLDLAEPAEEIRSVRP